MSTIEDLTDYHHAANFEMRDLCNLLQFFEERKKIAQQIIEDRNPERYEDLIQYYDYTNQQIKEYLGL